MEIKDPLLLGSFHLDYFKVIILFKTVKLFQVKVIFNKQFSLKSVAQILVCPLLLYSQCKNSLVPSELPTRRS